MTQEETSTDPDRVGRPEAGYTSYLRAGRLLNDTTA